LGKLLLNVYLFVAFTVLTLVGLAVLPLILLINVIFLSRTLATGMRLAIGYYGWILVRIVPFFEPVTIEWKTKELPSTAILVANHNSAIDPYLFGALDLQNSFVTTWPFNIPIYGGIMRLAGYVNAGEGWDKVQEKCVNLLESGCSVTIWPEGHRSHDGKLGRFKNGAFVLATETGYPIVPICILGSGRVLPPGKRLLSPGKVKLVVLDPVYPGTGSKKQEIVRNMRTHTQTIIKQALQENGHFQENSAECCGCS